MNKRQAELISELITQFELMNETSNVGSTLIDIASIRRDLDESAQIRREVELQNRILLNELRSNFVSKLKQVKLELESIGILSELICDDYPNLHIGLKDYNGSLLNTDYSFRISYYQRKQRIDLSDGGSIQKIVGLDIYTHHSELFNSVDELVKTEKFINLIKRVAR